MKPFILLDLSVGRGGGLKPELRSVPVTRVLNRRLGRVLLLAAILTKKDEHKINSPLTRYFFQHPLLFPN
jgi:hypothetical protein